MNSYGKDTHILRYQSSKDIMGKIRDYILTHTDKLNDFTTGSALETLVEAISDEIELYYQLSVTNIRTSIDQAIYSAFNLNRLPEVKAYGTFVLDFGEPLESALEVPAGMIFKSSNPYYDQTYITVKAYDVPEGTQSIEVLAFCTEGGKKGNVPANVIDEITNYQEAYTVTNPTAISTGRDSESLSAVKIRFRNLIQALQRGTVQAVQYGALTASPYVQGAFVDESVGYVRVFCNDANGDLPPDLQRKIQANMVYWRPAGIPVEVFPVNKSIVDIGVTLDIPNKSLHKPQLADMVRNALTRYINDKNASQDLVLNEIVSQLMNLNGLGIDNCQVNIYVTPPANMIDNAGINSYNNLILNEHAFNKDLFAPQDKYEFNKAYLTPKDRSHFHDYVHTPGAYDNPPYASNRHGDGYLPADMLADTTDDNGMIDNNNDNWVVNPLPSLSNNYQMSYQASIINSLSASATAGNHIFRYDQASSYASSEAMQSSTSASLSNKAYSQVQGSLVDSMSASASIVGGAFDKSYATSLADSYLAEPSYSSELSSADKSDASVKSSASSASYSPTETTAPAVSAGDATLNRPLRVVNRYKTQGNEILRAGTIDVDFNS